MRKTKENNNEEEHDLLNLIASNDEPDHSESELDSMFLDDEQLFCDFPNSMTSINQQQHQHQHQQSKAPSPIENGIDSIVSAPYPTHLHPLANNNNNNNATITMLKTQSPKLFRKSLSDPSTLINNTIADDVESREANDLHSHSRPSSLPRTTSKKNSGINDDSRSNIGGTATASSKVLLSNREGRTSAQDQGPWTLEALDLFDFWPPGRQRPC